MKKKLLALVLALACSATCAVALTACDSDSSSGSTNTEQGGNQSGDKTEQGGNNNEQGGNQSGDKTEQGGNNTEQGGGQGTADATAVTAQQWNAAFEANITNYTTVATQGETVVSASKFDGDKLELETSGIKAIYGKVGDTYYGYMYYQSTWTRTTIPESAYTQMTASSSEGFTYFKDKYGEFTYANGAYTAATLSVQATVMEQTQTMTMTNVKVTFNNGALTEMEYDSQGMHCVLNNIGSTTVTLPTDFVDPQA